MICESFPFDVSGAVLIVDAPPAVGAALAADGWRVAYAPVVSIDPMPDMIVLGGSAEGQVAAWRARGPAFALVPMLAMTEPAGPLFDGTTGWPDAAACVRAAAAWRPGQTLATLDRLRGAFGADEVAALLARFRTLLVKAVEDGTRERMFAHRVAGIAGTLGFADTGRVWLRLSQGDASAAEPARRAALRAIRLIADQISRSVASENDSQRPAL